MFRVSGRVWAKDRHDQGPPAGPWSLLATKNEERFVWLHGENCTTSGREENETEGKGRMTDIDTNPMSVCDSVIIRENIKAIMSVWY